MAMSEQARERKRAADRARQAKERPERRAARLAYHREWYRKHREAERAKQRAYRESPEVRDQIREQKAEHYAMNKDEIRERQTERRGMSRREYHLLTAYGLTLAAYDQMLAAQNGRCAACDAEPVGQEGRYAVLHVDHDHVTGENRGLLCFSCNITLGHLGDNPDRLLQLATYLLRKQDLLSVLVQEG